MPTCSDILSGWYGHLNRVLVAVINKRNRGIRPLNAINRHRHGSFPVAGLQHGNVVDGSRYR